MSSLLQYLLSGIAVGAAFGLIGLGFVAIYRVTGIVNFAQGAFAILGGFVMSSLLAAEMNGLLAALVACAIVGLVGVCFGVIALGTHRSTILASLMITLGLSILTEGVALLAWGDIPVSFHGVGSRAFTVLGAAVLPQQVMVVVVAVAAFLLLQGFFGRTYLGKALTACSLNRRAGLLVGIDVRAMALLAFALSAMSSAMAGVVTTPMTPVTYNSDVGIAVSGFTAAIFGGLVSPAGAMAGGLVIGILEQLVAGYFNPAYQTGVALLLMVILLVARPRGLFVR